MNKTEFMAQIKDMVKISTRDFKDSLTTDTTIRCFLNDMSDLYCKNGWITASQYNRWTWTAAEKNSIKKLALKD